MNKLKKKKKNVEKADGQSRFEYVGRLFWEAKGKMRREYWQEKKWLTEFDFKKWQKVKLWQTEWTTRIKRNKLPTDLNPFKLPSHFLRKWNEMKWGVFPNQQAATTLKE